MRAVAALKCVFLCRDGRKLNFGVILVTLVIVDSFTRDLYSGDVFPENMDPIREGEIESVDF
jgi:hypothetical protein